MQSQPGTSLQLSETAILVSLFGWGLIPDVPRDPSQRTSLSRATSRAPSVLRTPSISRASSVQPTPFGQVANGAPPTPTPGATTAPPMTPTPSRQLLPITPVRVPSTPFTFRMPFPPSSGSRTDNTLLQCALCQRRIGLWAFSPQPVPEAPSTPRADADTVADPLTPALDSITSTPAPAPAPMPQKKLSISQRQFDLLKEHRSYCPYVVRSTIIPTLPVVSPFAAKPVHGHTLSGLHIPHMVGQLGQNALEGWRAVLTVVLRYGAGQQKRMGLDLARDETQQVAVEVDSVKAMMEGVKSHGVSVLFMINSNPSNKLFSCNPGQRLAAICQRPAWLIKCICTILFVKLPCNRQFIIWYTLPSIVREPTGCISHLARRKDDKFR